MLSLLLRLFGVSFLLRLLRRPPRVVRLADVVHEPRALLRDLIVTGSAPARAFFDAPGLDALPAGRRLEVANGLALEASRLLPPYAEITQGDLVFVAHVSEDGRVRACEASLRRFGGRVRRAGGAWTDLSPEAALDIERVLRGDRFWDLPAVVPEDDLDAVWGALWLVRYARGQHHVLRRVETSGKDRELILAVLGVLAGAAR